MNTKKMVPGLVSIAIPAYKRKWLSEAIKSALSQDYKNIEVIIVDEFTGRSMFGRRYSDGLHQAIEAKEGLHVQRESKTLATITFQKGYGGKWYEIGRSF